MQDMTRFTTARQIIEEDSRCNDSREVRLRLNTRLRKIDFFLDGQWIYDLDLDVCRTTAEALCWIRQVAEKTWASTRTISELCTILLGPNDGTRERP